MFLYKYKQKFIYAIIYNLKQSKITTTISENSKNNKNKFLFCLQNHRLLLILFLHHHHSYHRLRHNR